MSDIEPETLRPVAAPDHLEQEDKAKGGDFYSRSVYILAMFVGFVALIMSGLTFVGFAENDQNITHLISAFGLCFGTGALAYGPMALIALYARKAIDNPLPRFRAIVVLLLMLPWFVLAGLVFRLSGTWQIIAALGALVATFISFWAIRYFRLG